MQDNIRLDEDEIRRVVAESLGAISGRIRRNENRAGFMSLLEQIYEMMRRAKNPDELGLDDRKKYVYNRLSVAVSEMLGKELAGTHIINGQLHESRSIKSGKLAKIIRDYGGFERYYDKHKPTNYGVDVYNLTDDDIIGVLPYGTTQRQAYDIAKKNGMTYNTGDSIGWIHLRNDMGKCLFCIVRGGNQFHNEYYDKKREREDLRRMPDGEKYHSRVMINGKNWDDLPDSLKKEYVRRYDKEHKNPVRSRAKYN